MQALFAKRCGLLRSLASVTCRLKNRIYRQYCSRALSLLPCDRRRQVTLTTPSDNKPASTELTGGAGFTYEDTVVAYYLTHLLRHERAAGQPGVVTSVAVQQEGHGNPMDDLVVVFDDAGTPKMLGLQVKRSITISGAKANADFRGIVEAAAALQASDTFVDERDACGFVVEHVADAPFRTLLRLIDWAKSSPDSQDFETRFGPTGTAGADELRMRDGLKAVIGSTSASQEVFFYRNFRALRMPGLEDGAVLRTEVVNRLQELVADNTDGQDILLFSRLCRIAREGAANAAKWTRASLLAQLHGSVRLEIAPNFADDIARLDAASRDALHDVSETVDEFHVARDALQQNIEKQLLQHRVVSIGGLPGSGKSAVLKHYAEKAAAKGPIIFLKNDRLQETSWATFGTAIGLRHSLVVDLLAEIGASGTPVLFIDGIDRVRPDQKNIIIDLIRVIDADPSLRHWKILATSRDQGLEAFRSWFPSSFYAATAMGTVAVDGFSEEEAERLAKSKPKLRNLLFSPSRAVEQIARRPFFAAVLAKTLQNDAEPQTEVDLIDAWWQRAGHDATDMVLQRQRALIEIAEKGVRNLGKGIALKDLDRATIDHIPALQADHILRLERGGAIVSFTHDIFFEWSFFRLLIELDDDWTSALTAAGEPPLLGRVVGLLAQDALTERGRWTAGYAKLESSDLRVQWRREWLTAAPFTHAFESAVDEFSQLVEANDFALCGKMLVWFQAQHTVPSPFVLNGAIAIEGVDRVRVADLMGWPSDGVAWGRLIEWLIERSETLPPSLVPQAVEVFGVWQNVLADFKNERSKKILATASAWLIDLEAEIHAEQPPRTRHTWGALGDEAQKGLATALRSLLFRSARSFPDFAGAVYERAVANKRMRDAAFDELMEFSPILSQALPEAVARVAETKLLKELPQDKRDDCNAKSRSG